MVKQKQFVRPPKKTKAKAAQPETADEFQEAADKEEEAGGKHRVGDPGKSARAFVRALDIYDQALDKHPTSFDLAYNKSRLQFEITQQPALVEHVGLPLIDILQQTLNSHRYALRLNEENPDVLFNTSQVLISLAEQLSESGDSVQAIPLLQEALEFLSSCLSRQEMLLEQQRMDFEDAEEGGVQLDPEERAASASGSDESGQTASVETLVGANDLLDTIHASLSALITIIPLVEPTALQTYGDMAHALTEKRAPTYISLLPIDLKDQETRLIALDRAIFIAALADAQFSFQMLELETYLQRLEAFAIPGKGSSAHILCAEAEARTEFAQSALERYEGSPDMPADTCWKQLTSAQDLYAQALKLETVDAEERKAEIYESRGSLELLRHRLVTLTGIPLNGSIQKSAPMLVQNASTYFKASTQIARTDSDADLEKKAKQRWVIAIDIGAALYGIEPKTTSPFDGNDAYAREELVQALEACVEEGLMAMDLGSEIARRIKQ